MKNILVIADPVDEPQVALRRALELARLEDSKVHIAILCHTAYYDVESGGNNSLKIKIIQYTERWWNDYLHELQQSKNNLKLVISHEVVWAKYPEDWVLEHCQILHYDLVVMTAHEREGLFYTPSEWQLFRDSKVPIYIASTNKRKTAHVVLAAIDVLSAHEAKQQMNRSVMEAAFRLSVITNAELHCCYVVHIPRVLRELDIVDVPAKARELEAQAREAAKPLLDAYQVDDARFHVKEGAPGAVIDHFAHQLRAQCTVIGTLGRTGIKGKLIGNTCEKALRHIHGDMMLVSHQDE